jgi:hypothetical protein
VSGSRDDGGEMTAGFSSVPPVRKELRSVGPGTPTHIVDGFVWNAGVLELEANERSEVTVWLAALPSNDRRPVRGLFQSASDVFIDFERIDSDVGADRHDELGGILRKGVDRAWHDSGNRATPARVGSTDMTARWMRDQHRHAVGRSRGDPNAVDARDQRIAFCIGDRVRKVVA